MKITKLIILLFSTVVLCLGQKVPDDNNTESLQNEFPVKVDQLSLSLNIKVYPEDPIIGPLIKKSSSEVQSMYIRDQIITPFIDEIQKGYFDKSKLLSDNIIPVERDLKETILASGFKAQFNRIGNVEVNGNSAYARFRFKGENNGYTGTIYLKEIDRKWIIEDIEISAYP